MHNNELTPRQQATELIRQANSILVITGREPGHDQLAAAVALQRVLNRLEKQAYIVISDPLPKSAEIFDTQFVSKTIDGIRDFIIDVNMHEVSVDKLKYNVEDDHLKVTITPRNGNFDAKDVSFEQGPFQFDLVIVLGVAQIGKIDRIVSENPTIFDGLHLINIDFHRINENYGSVNVVDTNSSSVCEILVSLIESLEQGMIDETVATALLCGIMSTTANFTTPSTTPKSMTIAAQMLSAGAKQQEIVRVLHGKPSDHSHKPASHQAPKSDPKPQSQPDVPTVSMKEAFVKAQAEANSKEVDDVAGEPIVEEKTDKKSDNKSKPRAVADTAPKSPLE